MTIPNFDFTWVKPTKSQLSVLKSFPKGVDNSIHPRQACEFIITAPYSLWYLEIKRYANGVFQLDVSKDEIKFFIEGCLNICSLVDSGYNAEEDRWWAIKIPTTDDEYRETNRYLMSIANALILIQGIQKGHPLMVEMLDTFANIVLSKNWKKEFYGAVEKSKENIKKKAKLENKKNGSKGQDANLKGIDD